jgi:hypothetical protein
MNPKQVKSFDIEKATEYYKHTAVVGTIQSA